MAILAGGAADRTRSESTLRRTLSGIPPGLLAARLLKRAAFMLGDNPLTMGALRLLGAAGNKRSRLSDLYYYIIFRRNVLAGYSEAKRLTRAARRNSKAGGGSLPPWVVLTPERAQTTGLERRDG